MSTPRTALLVSLTLVVGAAHWWFLHDFASNDTVHIVPAPNAPVFETRSIAPPPPPPPPPTPTPEVAITGPAPKPPPKPKPKPQPAPQSVVPEPVTAPAPISSADVLKSTTEATAPVGEAALPLDAAVPDHDGALAAGTTAEPNAPEDDAAATGALADAAHSESASAAPAGIRLRTAPGQAEQTDLTYQAPPAQLLQFKVQGQAKGFDYSASAQLRWQPQDGSYQASQEVSAFLLGKRAQSSRGQITEGGLQPERFEDLARKKLRATTLDWASGMARFEPQAPALPIAAGTQDRLSVFLQLAGMVAAAPQRYPAGATISVPTASTRGLQTWVFQVLDSAQLDLPAGMMETVRLERLPQGGREQKAELWLAPALGYLPVRIRLSESNGDYTDLHLQSHSAL